MPYIPYIKPRYFFYYDTYAVHARCFKINALWGKECADVQIRVTSVCSRAFCNTFCTHDDEVRHWNFPDSGTWSVVRETGKFGSLRKVQIRLGIPGVVGRRGFTFQRSLTGNESNVDADSVPNGGTENGLSELAPIRCDRSCPRGVFSWIDLLLAAGKRPGCRSQLWRVQSARFIAAARRYALLQRAHVPVSD